MVCHIGGQLGTKVVISALGMLALYMCFNGTGIWGGETMCVGPIGHLSRVRIIYYNVSAVELEEKVFKWCLNVF